MTQQEFDGLPGLMTRKQFMQVTGLNKENLRELCTDKNKLKRYHPKKGGYAKYYKRDAARIGGFLLR